MPRRAVPMAKLAASAALVSVLTACANVAPVDAVANRICYPTPLFDNDNHELLQVVANETLADLRLEVTDLFITNKTRRSPERRGNVILPTEDRIIIGYNAWARVDQCESGQVIVQFDRYCNVQQVYTRYGCDVAGLPGYSF
ncbi:MAG: hypothetical protein AAFW76_04095 [Pseudomonadota bacterium]